MYFPQASLQRTCATNIIASTPLYSVLTVYCSRWRPKPAPQKATHSQTSSSARTTMATTTATVKATALAKAKAATAEAAGATSRGHPRSKGIIPTSKACGIVYTIEGGASQYDESTRRILEHLLAEGKARNGKDIRAAVLTLTPPVVANWAPNPLPAAQVGNQVQEDLQRERVKGAYRREVDYDTNSTALFSLVLGQCSLELRDKLFALPNWDALNADCDTIDRSPHSRQEHHAQPSV